ncbi:MAG: hypothetical protein P1P77_11530 [Spirochaetaceae bacterium]|nr:hypothetical protein [Spirochaetaceae bacterium]
MSAAEDMSLSFLRVSRFGTLDSTVPSHRQSTIHLMKGVIYGLYGEARSGKDSMAQLLKGDLEFGKTEIRLQGQRLERSADLKARVHVIAPINYSVTDWSVAEYLMLNDSSSTSAFVNYKRLNREAQDQVHQLGFDIDVRRKIGQISEYEKRIVDLVKANGINTHLIVIEDPFDGMSFEHLGAFARTLSSFIQDRCPVVVNSPLRDVNWLLSDFCLFFRGGFIVRKVSAVRLESDPHLKNKLLGIEAPETPERLKVPVPTNPPSSSTISIKGIPLKFGRRFDLELKSGQIATIIVPDLRDRMRLFSYLSGRRIHRDIAIYMDQNRVKTRSLSDFVRLRIVSSANLGTETELFPHMTLGENILLPSYCKVSSTSFLIQRNQVGEVIGRNILDDSMSGMDSLAVETNESLRIVFARWLVFRPRVLVLLEPFTHCAAPGENLVSSYINLLAKRGSTVVLVQSREMESDIANPRRVIVQR